MSDDTTVILQQWVAALAEALATDAPFDVDAVLALAGDAAHAVVRPAAPLTTFIAGYAAATAVQQGADPATAMADAIAAARAAAETWAGPDGA